jgi:hypothetical protein
MLTTLAIVWLVLRSLKTVLNRVFCMFLPRPHLPRMARLR